jgi:hypothetical protein
MTCHIKIFKINHSSPISTRVEIPNHPAFIVSLPVVARNPDAKEMYASYLAQIA